MREIKFRAWSIITKMMYQWGDIFHLPAWEIFPGTPEQRALEIMQFTGLHDRNGKEVYEGDVVKCSGFDDICVVHYANICACYISLPYWKSYEYWENDPEEDIENYFLWDNIEIEIIGNIHENPELLKSREERGGEHQ